MSETIEVIKELSPIITKIANQLGVASEHIWGVLVRQAYVEGITDLMLCLVIIVLTVCYWKFIRYAHKKICYQSEKDSWDSDILAPIYVTGAILGFIGAILFVIGMSSAVGKFLNPEYYALQILTNLIK